MPLISSLTFYESWYLSVSVNLKIKRRSKAKAKVNEIMMNVYEFYKFTIVNIEYCIDLNRRLSAGNNW